MHETTKGIGITLDANKTGGDQSATEGEKGPSLNISMKVSGDAESTTKSAVSEETITVTKPQSILRPCRKRKPTRRRTHRQASISLGIFAQESSPSPHSAFRRPEERSTPTIEVPEASPASSQARKALTSTSQRTPTSKAPSSPVRRKRERTASRREHSPSAT